MFAEAVDGGRAAVFIGAGLSMPAGFVDWKSLLRPLAEDVALDVDRESELLKVAQYAVNEAGGRARVSARILAAFDVQSEPTDNHRALARLPIRDYWTTNYDSLLEDALRTAGRTAAVKHNQIQLAGHPASATTTVYKMHGDKTQPDECVLTQDDYEHYADSRGEFIDLLRGSLLERTFLFLGLSFTDPNIDHVLSRLRVRYGSHRREHFWVTKRVTLEECVDAEDLAYRRGREDLRVRDLQRYGIQTLLVDNHQAITVVLHEVHRLLKRRAVFISGAVHDYTPLGQSTLEGLVRRLGERMMAEGYTLISGGGLGIGTAAVLGAVTGASLIDSRREKRVHVMAFDQNLADRGSRSAAYQEYRTAMLRRAGFAVFVSGNKMEGDAVVPSTGVSAEFNTALAEGALPIPIGSTGHVALKLWEMVRGDHRRYYPDDRVVPHLHRLGPDIKDSEVVLNAVFEIMHLYDGRRH